MGKIIENYELKEQLGEGVYAKVYKAVHMVTKQQVAIKVVQAQKFKQIPKLEQCTVNEINILSNLQSCPYIVKYIDMLKTANNFYFVYEYCNGGTMDKLIQREGPFPEKRALSFFRQMLEAFKVLSKSNIMHRDIKPDNILIHNGSIKIADFGFCKPLESQNDMVQTMLGSPIYMAPEVIKGQVYTNKADIWSLGVVLYQMVFGKCPFESKSIAKLIKMLEDEDVVLPESPKVSATLQKLLKRILVKDFTNRIDWKQLFEYTITENGDIYAPGVSPTAQFGLRASIRNSSGFGSGLNFSNHSYSQGQGNPALTDSGKGGSPLLSPKPPREAEEARSYLMKKKSPLKDESANGSSISNPNNSINNTINNSINNNTSISGTGYGGYSMKEGKGEKNNRFELLLKNHGKCFTLNQMVLDLFRLEQPKSLLIAFLIFRSIEREVSSLQDSLKKDTHPDDAFREFKALIQKEADSVRLNLGLLRQCIDEEGELKAGEVEGRKSQVLRGFLQAVRLGREQEMVLILQIVDYLQQSILIKKDAYQKLTKQHLQKQVKFKISKYTDQDLN